jgi:serine/threonine-protein kinase RsbW
VTAPGRENEVRRILAELSVPSEPGNERRAMEEVAAAVGGLGLDERTLEKLKTAVAEATMNAMEHGNEGPPVPAPETPDLEAKLDGMQTPRGWGLFLIRSMVDEMKVGGDEDHHTVELVLHLAAPQKGGT